MGCENTAVAIKQWRRRGFEIFVINPFGMHGDKPWELPSHSFNPFDFRDPASPTFSADAKVCAEILTPRSGREVKDWGIPGTVSQAIAIGRALQAARQAHADPIEAVLAETGGRRLFTGNVIDVERRTSGSYLFGGAGFEGPGGGHYENMMGNYASLGCGVYIQGDGITIVQDFGN